MADFYNGLPPVGQIEGGITNIEVANAEPNLGTSVHGVAFSDDAQVEAVKTRIQAVSAGVDEYSELGTGVSATTIRSVSAGRNMVTYM